MNFTSPALEQSAVERARASRGNPISNRLRIT